MRVRSMATAVPSMAAALALVATVSAGFAPAAASTSAVPFSSQEPVATADYDLMGDPFGLDLIGSVPPSFDSGDLPPSRSVNGWQPGMLRPTTQSGIPLVALAAPGTAAPSGMSAPGTVPVPLGKPGPLGVQAWFVRPIPDPIVSPFGPRFHPILHYMRMHNGVDMGAKCGTPIVAAAAGTVTFSGVNGGYGNLIVIDHGVHDGKRMQTKYAHMSALGARVGQKVQPGTGIGLVGTTGLSTACHLHFEVKLDGVYVNPAPFLEGSPTAIPSGPIVPVTASTLVPSTGLVPIKPVAGGPLPSAQPKPSTSALPSIPGMTPAPSLPTIPGLTPTPATPKPSTPKPSTPATPGTTPSPAPSPKPTASTGTPPVTTTSPSPKPEASTPAPSPTTPSTNPSPVVTPTPSTNPSPVVTPTLGPDVTPQPDPEPVTCPTLPPEPGETLPEGCETPQVPEATPSNPVTPTPEAGIAPSPTSSVTATP